MSIGERPAWQHHPRGRDARNIAAAALVAAKVYEHFQWVRWHGPRREDMHVPGPEEITQVLLDLEAKALAAKDQEHVSPIVGHLRFLAWADDDGDDSAVDFFITIGSTR